jgi:hypothetical protein
VEEVRGRGPEIQRALQGDASILTRIAFAGKAHWGYPDRWMERWREDLTITPEYVHQNEVHVAIAEGGPAGFYALVGEGRRVELEHLWVLPERMGKGVGIEADPNAEGFYKRMGASHVGEIVYEIDGRERVLPLLAMYLYRSGLLVA